MKQPILITAFATFMWCISYGLMHAIIGMIVDSVIERVDKMKSETAQVDRYVKLEIIKKTLAQLGSIDSDHSGALDGEESENGFRNPEFR